MFIPGKHISYFDLIEFGHIAAFLSQFEVSKYIFRFLRKIGKISKNSQILENQAKSLSYGVILIFRTSRNMHLRVTLSVWILLAKTLETLSTCRVPPRSRWGSHRATGSSVKFWKMAQIVKIHIFRYVAPLVAGMELHRSPSDPQLNLSHFMYWLYWDWRRCKKSEELKPIHRCGAQRVCTFYTYNFEQK